MRGRFLVRCSEVLDVLFEPPTSAADASSYPLHFLLVAFQLLPLGLLAVFSLYISVEQLWERLVFTAELCQTWVGSRRANRRSAASRPPA